MSLIRVDHYGAVKRAWSNQTFVNGSLSTYQKTEYRSELADPNTYSRGNLRQVANTWHWWDPFANAWDSRVLVQNDYTYSDTGNRLTNAISDQNGPVRTEAYGYDELSRLTSVDYGDGEQQGYVFDPMGNRLQKSVNGTPESYTYNAANMLLTRGGLAYSNDANGNTLSGGGRTMTWDGQNRMVECTFNAVTTSHVYGSDGLRRRMTKGTEVTDYVLDGQSAVRTLVNSVVDRTYLHGARGPEYERVGANAPVWYLYDGLGSVLGTVDASGNLVSTRKYDVYGAVRGSTGPSGTKHKFVGQLGHPSEDDTGLVYMRARWMDPSLGRFTSEDPMMDGRNWYAYVNSNPANVIDRTGNSGDDYQDPGLEEATWEWLGQQLRKLREAVRRIRNEVLPADEPEGKGDEVSPDDNVAQLIILTAVATFLIVAAFIAAVRFGARIVTSFDKIRAYSGGAI